MTEPTNQLFKYHDNSTLKVMQASEVANLQIWKGNRIIDYSHCNAIRKEIGDDVKRLDLKPFHIVEYDKEAEYGSATNIRELIDGQHRATILKEFFDNKGYEWKHHDFPVLAIIKRCANEEAIIDYFRMLNNTKSIEWQDDPNMVANRYIESLLRRFNSVKRYRIRQGKHDFRM
jgi:hypothetical protein